jgi:HSP20 family molecular chaperone IbpA
MLARYNPFNSNYTNEIVKKTNNNIGKWFDSMATFHNSIWDKFDDMLNITNNLISPSIVDGKISYTVDVPGIKKEDIDISQEGNTIRVRAERKGKIQGIVEASFSVSTDCDLNSLSADLADGVLILSFNKIEDKIKSEIKKIEIK